MFSFYFSPTFDWMRRISVRPSKHNRKVSLVFNHLEPMELAEHLSYLEYKAFRRINVSPGTSISVMILNVNLASKTSQFSKLNLNNFFFKSAGTAHDLKKIFLYGLPFKYKIS